jgi:leucyl aminopeptidase
MSRNLYRVSRLALALSLLASPTAAFANVSFDTADADMSDHIVVFLDEDANMPSGMDAQMEETLERALEASGFTPSFGTHQTFYGLQGLPTVTAIGTERGDLDRRDLHDLGGHLAKVPGNAALTVYVEGLETNAATPSAELALGYKLGAYRFDTYKSEKSEAPRDLIFAGGDAEISEDLLAEDYDALADAVAMTRDLGNAPGLDIYPASFVERVQAEARGIPNLKVTVMGKRELQREGMGAILGVGKGSVHDPRLMILEYSGAGANDAPLALVGKGITFDTGGISLKPNSGQWLMKSDLSGAAAVGGAVIAAAKRAAEINLVGVMPLAENMPSGDAIRPGDVLETYNGKTIEVMSTDAEGRLLLVDAVPYTIEKYEPELVVNIATLTGSAARALSDEYGAVITRDFDLAQDMMDIGDRSGEDVWPLPLHPNHYVQIKSDIADIKSTAGNPGASIGAAVVGTFVDEDQPWVHLDIAGVDSRDSATPTAPKGHAGWGVRFMDQLVRDYEDK